MKKIIVIALLTVAMSFAATPASAQLQFGFKGGLNMSNLSASDIKTSYRPGYFAGPSIRWTKLVHGFGFDASLFYDQKSVKMNKSTPSAPLYDPTLHYLDVTYLVTHKDITLPVNVRYDFNLSPQVGVFLAVGPQLDVNESGRNSNWQSHGGGQYDGGTKALKPRRVKGSLNFGVGATVGKHIEAELTYNMDLGKEMYSMMYVGVSENLLNGFRYYELTDASMIEAVSIDRKANINTFRLSLAYYF